MYGTVEAVAVELGRPALTDIETDQLEQWIARAENLIRARIPDIDERTAVDPALYAMVADVVTAAVARVARNPEGLRQVTISADDGTVSRTRDSVLSDGQLRITDAEWALLLPTPSFTLRRTGSGPGVFYTDPWPRRA